MQFAYKVINLLFEYESQKGFFNKNLVQSQSADFTQQRKICKEGQGQEFLTNDL